MTSSRFSRPWDPWKCFFIQWKETCKRAYFQHWSQEQHVKVTLAYFCLGWPGTHLLGNQRCRWPPPDSASLDLRELPACSQFSPFCAIPPSILHSPSLPWEMPHEFSASRLTGPFNVLTLHSAWTPRSQLLFIYCPGNNHNRVVMQTGTPGPSFLWSRTRGPIVGYMARHHRDPVVVLASERPGFKLSFCYFKFCIPRQIF